VKATPCRRCEVHKLKPFNVRALPKDIDAISAAFEEFRKRRSMNLSYRKNVISSK